MDERVRLMGTASNCGCIDPETGDACGYCQRENAAALAALEAAGYVIEKRNPRRRGWMSG